ncbi:unnamed protein product, partial [Ixodes pacificus]
MPRNCCVPLCGTAARKDPGIGYHEFPCDPERRLAWLKNISREGPGRKGSKWEPNDRSVVCALHFTEDDYKKTTKLRVLLPSAVPTQFPNYPQYMRKENGPARKRPRSNHSDGSLVKGVVHKPEDLAESPIINEAHLLSGRDERKTPAPDACIEMWSENALLADEACQTSLNLAHMMDELKKTEHRLKAQIARQKSALQKLQAKHDEINEQLRGYEDDKQIQDFRLLLEAAEEGDKTALFIKTQVTCFSKKK